MSTSIKSFFIVVGIISIFCTVFVLTTIFSVKKLKVHPSIMIGYISLFEAISSFHTIVWVCGTVEVIEYLGLEKLFKGTFFFLNQETPGNTWYAPCMNLCVVNQRLGVYFFQMMSLGMNLCLCIDLILTLRAPFYPAKRRLKFYLLGSFLFSCSVLLATWQEIERTCSDASNAFGSSTGNTILAIVLSIYIMFALFSIIYAGRMLSRPGISGDIKNMFMRKHVLYTICFIVIWSVTLTGAYQSLYNSLNDDEEDRSGMVSFLMPNGRRVWASKVGDKDLNIHLSLVDKISFTASLSTGFVLAVIRFMEPYFQFLIKKTFKSLYGINIDYEEEAKKNSNLSDTYSAFLNSSLNIELVHIILKSITEECTRTWIIESTQDAAICDSHFSEVNEYELDEIKINAKQWQICDAGEDDEQRALLNDDFVFINEDIKVTELAPKVFAAIRREDNISNEMIKYSLSPDNNRDQAFKAGEGQGKSGSFFFFSHDS